MPARPNEFPDFNINDTASVTPNASLTADGYPLNSRPTRQGKNWLLHRAGRWFRWLVEKMFLSSDLFADQSLFVANVPSLGAGMSIAAADFSGRIYVNGLAVGPVDSPAYTYTVNADTYWDLSEDGVWTPAVVASGAGAPAVPANHVRVYRVRTDATDRTEYDDYLPADGVQTARPLDLLGGVTTHTSGMSWRSNTALPFTPIGTTVGNTGPGDLFKQMLQSYDVFASSGGPGFIHIINGTPTPIATIAVADPAEDTWALYLSTTGLYLLHHPTTGADFANAVSSTNWDLIARLDQNGVELGPALGSGAGVAGTAYRDMVVRARGQFNTGSVPGFTNARNIASITYPSGNLIRVTFQAAITNTYTAIPACHGSLRRIVEVLRTADYIDFFQVDTSTGAPDTPASTGTQTFELLIVGE